MNYRCTPEETHKIQDVLDRAQPGDHISFAPGVYRASLMINACGTAENPIVIEAETPGSVVITGCDVVEGWQPDPKNASVFWVDMDLSFLGYDPKHGLLPSRREQVFVDGMALRAVLHYDQLTGGKFFYDSPNQRIYICPQPFTGEPRSGKLTIDAGSITGGGNVEIDRNAPENCWQFLITPFNPEKHTIEVSVRSQAFATAGSHKEKGAEHLIIRGLTIRGSADAPQKEMARFGGAHLLVEDCLFEAGGARGFGLRCSQSVFRRCVARLNGQMGFSGDNPQDVLVEDCYIAYNNTKHSDFFCFEQGGCKICRSDRVTIRGCRFNGNDGPAIWFDIDNTNAVIEQNWCEGNSGPGVMYEISSDAVIRNNICYKNGYAYKKDARFNSILNSVGHIEPVYGQGILVQMSRRVLVHNNTCVGNRRCGIELRHHAYQQAGNAGHSSETYRSENNRVVNNLLADNGWDNLMITEPPHNPSKTDEVRNNEYDFNLFHNSEALLQTDNNLNAYCRWGKTQRAGSQSLEEWRVATHQDLNSIQWDPYFVAPDEKDFRVELASPVVQRGCPIEGFNTDFHGRPRPEGKPSIGAFEPVATIAENFKCRGGTP